MPTAARKLAEQQARQRPHQTHAAAAVLATGSRMANWIFDLANSPATPATERVAMRQMVTDWDEAKRLWIERPG